MKEILKNKTEIGKLKLDNNLISLAEWKSQT